MERRWLACVGPVAALAALALASCQRDPEILARSVVVYSPRSCPVSESQAFSVIYAGGDFEPTSDHPPIASLFLREIGRTMSELPTETRAVVVDVSERDLEWRGLAELPRAGSINVLVWRGSETCRLTRDVERRTDMAFGVIGRHFMVAGGRSLDGAQVPHTFVGDLSTGAIERLDFGLGTRRVRPSITAFRSPVDPPNANGGLIAGGSDPDSDMPLATAEVYRPNLGAPSDVGDFEQQRIDLSEPRTRHGAVVLASGETLLVGGRGAAGPLRTMEIVDPVTRRARTAGVSLLGIARESPTVIRLSNGEILVAGGLDVNGKAIPTIEWFAADASHATKRPVDLVTGRERAFVPLEAGGALAIVVPETPLPDFETVWVISADGTLEPGLPIDPFTLDTARLYAGAEGAPLLWTGQRWLRWSPWFGAFQAIGDAPTTGPSLDAIAAGDPGLALWLDDRGAGGMNITGFRFAARTRFGAVPNPLLVTSTDQLAPDRLPGTSVHFDAGRGLTLVAGASAFLTDVTFADFALDVDIVDAAPIVVVRDEHGEEIEVGGPTCAFGSGATRTIAVRRRGPRLSVSADGGPVRVCPTELGLDVRVALGLRGGQGATGTSTARNLRVVRE